MIEMISNSIYEANFLRGLTGENPRSNYPLPGVEAIPGSEEEAGSDIVEITGKNKEESAGYNNIKKVSQTNKDEQGKTENKPGDSKNPGELSDEEQKEVRKLKETDRKVRAHEMAHLAAASGIAASGANFEYKRGPDGVNYAVGGDVKIDISKEKDPEATIKKAQQVAAAALAPSDPSPQDRAVASKARQMEAQARMELAKSREADTKNKQDPNEQQDNTGSTQSDASGDTASANRTAPHPGIRSYKQNQAFAPVTAQATPTNNNIQSNNTIPINGYWLDMAA